MEPADPCFPFFLIPLWRTGVGSLTGTPNLSAKVNQVILCQQGGREVDDFIKYLAKEATSEMKGFDRKGKKKGEKKKKTEL